jgi:hypothetical protein
VFLQPQLAPHRQHGRHATVSSGSAWSPQKLGVWHTHFRRDSLTLRVYRGDYRSFWMWVWLAVARCLAPVTFTRYSTACVIRLPFKFLFVSIAVGYYRLLSTRVWLAHSATPVILVLPWYATYITVIRHVLFLFRANQALILCIAVFRSGRAMLYYMLLPHGEQPSFFFFCIICSNLNFFFGLVLYLVKNTVYHSRNQGVTMLVAMATGMWRPQPLSRTKAEYKVGCSALSVAQGVHELTLLLLSTSFMLRAETFFKLASTYDMLGNVHIECRPASNDRLCPA